MANRELAPSTNIEVLAATSDQQPIVANLLELYSHDFGDFHDLELDQDGRFGYPDLPLYWSEPNRHPLLAWVDGKLAGFILIRQGSAISGDPTIWDMAEFFVIRRYRRLGIGTRLAHEIWRRFPGLWEVRVMEANHAACIFWGKAIAAFVGHAIQYSSFGKSGEPRRLYSFESLA
jgi:predicted acetyltransferase